MRLGVLTTSYPRWPTDYAGCFVAQLAAALADGGGEVQVLAPAPAVSEHPGVEVVALRHRPGASALLAGSGAPQALLSSPSLGGRLEAWAEAPAFVARLAFACARRARRCDALLSHWLVPCGLVGAAMTSLPHLAIAHGSDVRLLARLPGKGALLRGLSRRRSGLLLTSEALREPLARAAWGTDRRTAVWIEDAPVERMGISVPLDCDSEQTAAARGARPRLLYLGRLVPEKGVGLLLEAAAALRQAVEVVILGDGPERSALEERARSLGLPARFLGTCLGPSKWAELRRADLFVAPSRILPDGRQDSAPVALLEALAAGLPVVAGRVGGIAELLDHGKTGMLVAPDDVRELRDTLEHLLADAGLRDALSSAGRRLAEAHDWRSIAPRIQAHLEAL